jgi:hypothetical protein
MNNPIAQRRNSIIPLKTSLAIIKLAKGNRQLEEYAFRLEFISSKGAEPTACLVGMLKEDFAICCKCDPWQNDYDYRIAYFEIRRLLVLALAKYAVKNAIESFHADIEYARKVAKHSHEFECMWLKKASHDILTYCIARQILNKPLPESKLFFASLSPSEIDAIKTRWAALKGAWECEETLQYTEEFQELMLDTTRFILEWK